MKQAECNSDGSQATIQAVTFDDICKRKRDLISLVAEIGKELPWQDRSKLQELLCEHHNVFAIEDGERGETDMIQMEINMHWGFWTPSQEGSFCCEARDSLSTALHAGPKSNSPLTQPIG